MDNLLKLPPDEFTTTLPKLSPVQMRALPLTMLQNDIRIANTVLDCYLTCNPSDCPPNQKKSKNEVWLTPLGYYYKQGERHREIGFKARSFGYSLGYRRSADDLKFGVQTDYLYSNLDWNQNAGQAKIHTAYLGPFLQYLKQRWHMSFALLVGRAFYDVDRKLNFNAIKRTAHHDHRGWDLLAGLSGGGKFKMPRSFVDHFFVAPGVKVNYLNIWESGYQERGADSINLSVGSKHSAFLNPQVDLKLIKEFPYDTFCLLSALRFGWQGLIPLSNARYISRFYKQQLCEPHFLVEGFTQSVNQLILGAQLTFSQCDTYSITLMYEANIGYHASVQQGLGQLSWKW